MRRRVSAPLLELDEIGCVYNFLVHSRSEMALRHAVATLAILLGQWQSLVPQTHTAPMLEIRVDTPKWVNGCLDLTVERANISAQTLYLPEWEGVIFSLSTKLTHDDPSKKDQEVWREFYGLSDIISLDAYQLAAGSKTTDHYCLPGTFAVVSQQGKTRRQVAVRGRLKIVVGYFESEEDWRAYKAANEKGWPTPRRSPSASWETLLPCSSQSGCTAECTTPPPITEGERVVVPDVFQFDKDWNERGKALADTLSRKYSACKN